MRLRNPVTAIQKCSRCSYHGAINTFPRKKNGSGYTKLCLPCTETKSSAKENVNTDKKRQSAASQLQPSTLALDDCLKLISMNKDNAFELDTFVILPEEKSGVDITVHEFANGLRDSLAEASDYHWK